MLWLIPWTRLTAERINTTASLVHSSRESSSSAVDVTDFHFVPYNCQPLFISNWIDKVNIFFLLVMRSPWNKASASPLPAKNTDIDSTMQLFPSSMTEEQNSRVGGRLWHAMLTMERFTI